VGTLEERENERAGVMRYLIKTHFYYGIPTSEIPDIPNRYIPDNAIIRTYIQTNMFGPTLLSTKYISQEQDCAIEECDI
jgi:hypothetical protein